MVRKISRGRTIRHFGWTCTDPARSKALRRLRHLTWSRWSQAKFFHGPIQGKNSSTIWTTAAENVRRQLALCLLCNFAMFLGQQAGKSVTWETRTSNNLLGCSNTAGAMQLTKCTPDLISYSKLHDRT